MALTIKFPSEGTHYPNTQAHTKKACIFLLKIPMKTHELEVIMALCKSLLTLQQNKDMVIQLGKSFIRSADEMPHMYE